LIPFTKAHACGNDFLIVTEEAALGFDPVELTRRLCARNTGVGADGIEFLALTGPNSGRIRLYNADGSIAEISGNGTRCVAAYMAEALHSKPGDDLEILTDAGPRICHIDAIDPSGEFTVQVTTGMGVPTSNGAPSPSPAVFKFRASKSPPAIPTSSSTSTTPTSKSTTRPGKASASKSASTPTSTTRPTSSSSASFRPHASRSASSSAASVPPPLPAPAPQPPPLPPSPCTTAPRPSPLSLLAANKPSTGVALAPSSISPVLPALSPAEKRGPHDAIHSPPAPTRATLRRRNLRPLARLLCQPGTDRGRPRQPLRARLQAAPRTTLP
jgi:hypothetical protein